MIMSVQKMCTMKKQNDCWFVMRYHPLPFVFPPLCGVLFTCCCVGTMHVLKPVYIYISTSLYLEMKLVCDGPPTDSHQWRSIDLPFLDFHMSTKSELEGI